MNKNDAYELLMEDLEKSVKVATERRAAKVVNRSKQLEKKSVDQGEREEEKTVKKADTNYKMDVQASCKQKTSDFESRQKLRGEELVALDKAIEIISSGALAGNAE